MMFFFPVSDLTYKVNKGSTICDNQAKVKVPNKTAWRRNSQNRVKVNTENRASVSIPCQIRQSEQICSVPSLLHFFHNIFLNC